jgi:hypothetical protein
MPADSCPTLLQAAPKPKKDKKPKAGGSKATDETLADPVAEKLRQQRYVQPPALASNCVSMLMS